MPFSCPLFTRQQQNSNDATKNDNLPKFHPLIAKNGPAVCKKRLPKVALTRGESFDELICFAVACPTWENSNKCNIKHMLFD